MSLDFRRELEYLMLGKIKPTNKILAVFLKKTYDKVENIEKIISDLDKNHKELEKRVLRLE